MNLTETRGRKARHNYPSLEKGETYTFTASDPHDIKDGVATYAYANKVVARIMRYSERKGLGWKIVRRTFGLNVEITILP